MNPDVEALRSKALRIKAALDEDEKQRQETILKNSFEALYTDALSKANLKADKGQFELDDVFVFTSRDEDGRDAAEDVTKLLRYIELFRAKGFGAVQVVKPIYKDRDRVYENQYISEYKWSIKLTW